MGNLFSKYCPKIEMKFEVSAPESDLGLNFSSATHQLCELCQVI